jgi:hypothetical protein
MQVQSESVSPTQQALALLLDGKELPSTIEGVAEAYGKRGKPTEEPPKEEGPSEEDTQEASPDVEGEESEESQADVVVAAGKKVKIDWNNKDQLKKAVQLAADRNDQKKAKDQALEQLKALQAEKAAAEAKNAELAVLLNQIDELKKQGPDAALKRLFGKDIAEIMAEADERAGWSEEQKKAHELQQENARLQALLEGKKTESQEVLDKIQQEKEAVLRQNVQNHFEASYRKHTFDGKLGNTELEDDLDTNLFENVKKKFNAKPLAEITPADIEAAFKAERARLVKIYGSQAESRTAAEIERKKKDALAAAQSKSTRGESKQTAQQRFDALRAAGKHKEILNDPVLRALL